MYVVLEGGKVRECNLLIYLSSGISSFVDYRTGANRGQLAGSCTSTYPLAVRLSVVRIGKPKSK